MSVHFIYRTTNLLTGEFLLAKRSTKQIKGDVYLGGGELLKVAIAKHGRGNFTRKILCITETKELNSEMFDLLIAMVGESPYHTPHKSIGRTKENHIGRKAQAEKVSGMDSPTKRIDVRLKMGEQKSGDGNPMHGKTGELSPSSKLSNTERLEIITLYETGLTRREILSKFQDRVSIHTINGILQRRAELKHTLKVG